MTFQQLTYVVEISKCGSINKAAHKLFLSQSGISTAVRELEEELGIQFFVRSNRGVEFTPEGKEFLSYAISLLEQKQRIESLYGEARNTAAPVRFSVSTQRYPFSEDAFLRMLQNTEENRYCFSAKEAGMDAVIDDVYDHRADIGVIFLTELTEKMIRRLLDSRDLEFHDQGVAADFSEEYQILSLKKPARCISVNNRSTMMNVLARTDAFTTGSGLLVENITSQAVVTVPLSGKTCIRLGWIVPKNSKLSPLAEQFVSYLEQSVAESIRFTDSLHQSLPKICSEQS